MTKWIDGLAALVLLNVAYGYHTHRVVPVVLRQQAGLRLWGTEPTLPDGPDTNRDPLPPSLSVTKNAVDATPTVIVRDTELGRMARGIARTGMKNVESLQVGDVVVAKYEIPSLNIWIDAGYEIIEVYSQGVNAATGQVEKIPLTTLEKSSKTGYTTYLKVYSPKYHSSPVVVTADEMGLITIKEELLEAMMLAIPGLFWVIVASSFASYYNGKYGGNFLDAFFRT